MIVCDRVDHSLIAADIHGLYKNSLASVRELNSWFVIDISVRQSCVIAP